MNFNDTVAFNVTTDLTNLKCLALGLNKFCCYIKAKGNKIQIEIEKSSKLNFTYFTNNPTGNRIFFLLQIVLFKIFKYHQWYAKKQSSKAPSIPK